MKDFVIREISASDPAYMTLAGNHGSVFNDPAWLKLFQPRLKLYGIDDQSRTRVGAFALWKNHLYGLPYYKNPLTTPHCALFYLASGDTVYKRNSFEKSIHAALAHFLKDLHPAIVQFNLPPGIGDVQPYLWEGFKVTPAYTYRLDLNPLPAEIMGGFDPKLRSDLAKAEKDGITVERTADLKVVSKLVRQTLDRKTRGVSFHLIDRILFEFAKPSNSFAFVAKSGSEPVAASFCVFDGTTAYYLLGGTDQKNRFRGAAASTLVASIIHSRETGLRTFDFEGSMVPSIESFFRGFGGELVVKYSVNRAWLPLEMVLKFVKRSVY